MSANFSLGELEKKAATGAGAAGAGEAALKRRRPSEQAAAAPDFFQTLAHTMHDIRKQILDLNLPPSSVELEFRIGMLVSLGKQRWQSSRPIGGCIALQHENAKKMGVEFVSGVDENVAERLHSLLKAEGYTGSYKEERVRSDSNSGQRCVVNAQGQEISAETKSKILRLDLGCVGHQYDGRIEVATEIAASGAVDMKTQKWTTERLKRRTSFRKVAQKPSAWQVDLTTVTTTPLVSGSGKRVSVNTTELEFEMISTALVQWLGSSEDDAHKYTSQFATELRDVMNLCIIETSEEGAGATEASNSQIVSVPRSQAIASEVNKLNSAIISATNTSFSPTDFLGSMPLNISRRNLILLQRDEYFVTEKSDGVRYLLYVVASSSSSGGVAAMFVDRAGNQFRPPGADAIAVGLKAGTVLDGEIVFNLHFQKSVFLVFDVLCNEGQPCAHLPFEERTALITGPVMARVGRINYQAPEGPLWIIRKKFWPKKDLKSLLKLMVFNKGKRIYRESEKRYHKSDGLIFQPNTPYVFGTDVTLVKWKWPELTSVDLQVVPNPRPGISTEPSLMAGGPDHTLVDCCMRGRSHVGLGTFDTFRLLADVRDSSCLVHIAEVSFNPKVGLWSYFQLRKDKDAPNFINTVMSILMEQAEDIDIDELVERLLPTATATATEGVSTGVGSSGHSSNNAGNRA